MTINDDPSTFVDKEKEALWYLGGQRIIKALGEQIKGAFPGTYFFRPAPLALNECRFEDIETIHRRDHTCPV